MSEQYIKAEIVRPKRPLSEQVGILIGSLVVLAFRVLIVWWAIAAWFPEYGLTYWQLVLPVYAFRALIIHNPQPGRLLTK